MQGLPFYSARLPYYVSFGVILSGMALLLFYTYLALAPHTHWFNYISVEPSKDTFEINEPLSFISLNERYRTVTMHWNDILRCDFDNDSFDYGFFSVYDSSAHNLKPSSLNTSSAPWTYQSRAPLVPSTCYLDTTITVPLPFGQSVVQEITSSKFRIE